MLFEELWDGGEDGMVCCVEGLWVGDKADGEAFVRDFWGKERCNLERGINFDVLELLRGMLVSLGGYK